MLTKRHQKNFNIYLFLFNREGKHDSWLNNCLDVSFIEDVQMSTMIFIINENVMSFNYLLKLKNREEAFVGQFTGKHFPIYRVITIQHIRMSRLVGSQPSSTSYRIDNL